MSVTLRRHLQPWNYESTAWRVPVRRRRWEAGEQRGASTRSTWRTTSSMRRSGRASAPSSTERSASHSTRSSPSRCSTSSAPTATWYARATPLFHILLGYDPPRFPFYFFSPDASVTSCSLHAMHGAACR